MLKVFLMTMFLGLSLAQADYHKAEVLNANYNQESRNITVTVNSDGCGNSEQLVLNNCNLDFESYVCIATVAIADKAVCGEVAQKDLVVSRDSLSFRGRSLSERRFDRLVMTIKGNSTKKQISFDSKF